MKINRQVFLDEAQILLNGGLAKSLRMPSQYDKYVPSMKGGCWNEWCRRNRLQRCRGSVYFNRRYLSSLYFVGYRIAFVFHLIKVN